MVCALHRLFQSEKDDRIMEGEVFPEEEIGMFDGWKERAKLEGILATLGGSMFLASRLSGDFKKSLAERHGIGEIRTRDRSVAWRFSISRGRLCVAHGPHPSPDFAMVYTDAPTAVEILMKGTEEASMQAISEGKLAFDGDMEFGMWFMELLQKLGAMMKERREKFSQWRT